MSDQYPECEYIGFQGGLITKYLFEETRYCFAYGQYLATIVLGLAFIEQSLASQFYAVGRDDLKRSTVSNLFDEALKDGWITQTEFDNLDHARRIRNPVAHFREYSKDDRLEMRAVEENDYPYSILESDAYHVMETIFHLMRRKLLCQMI